MNIPEELKKYKQWVVWKAVKNDKGKITKPPYSVKSGQRASIQNPAHWVDFETAVKAMPYYDGIGFVLTENDPFCCIDFDNHDGKCVLEKHELGAKHFKSFCEVSPSGNGLHVWLKGSVPSGREIPGIGGVYSKDRYITITGNTFIDAPIQTANGSLTKLWESGSKPIAPQVAPKPKVNTNSSLPSTTDPAAWRGFSSSVINFGIHWPSAATSAKLDSNIRRSTSLEGQSRISASLLCGTPNNERRLRISVISF